jgi:DNA-binding CsgD family transcriptional regulator
MNPGELLELRSQLRTLERLIERVLEEGVEEVDTRNAVVTLIGAVLHSEATPGDCLMRSIETVVRAPRGAPSLVLAHDSGRPASIAVPSSALFPRALVRETLGGGVSPWTASSEGLRSAAGASHTWRGSGTATREDERWKATARSCRRGERQGSATRERPASGWSSLTEVEQRVAELVALGLTNREVGRQMFLSRHTIDSHLRHVFDKLGINSRVQLARVAPFPPPPAD